ncbi:hypothetical protein C8R47DRAFT_995212 [Mycena vitilis]|nr:hypothetical protein C8R47DRAFT_999632 [Mycena vitilis]KAJ6448324.1 hypothetical protein C8R47DRAFT_999542 [Mycena vitilis]KAJ6448560.1 hypothetical protein C8R47DRAFT_1230983 [Mycena vitilis]KAJ6448666.1 hypothetical protein C8R47DRAFT_999476 [Mycena vitilis]KAJ6458375.1 hypothetical protein C8R47DRAFT_995212 [Mycena vitilis]
MTAPFVYVPEAYGSTPYSLQYPNPCFPSAQAGPAPFLPPSLTLYHSSPYLANGGNGFYPNPVLSFGGDAVQYAPSWIPPHARQRTSFWGAPAHASGPTLLSPPAPSWLTAQSLHGQRKITLWGTSPPWWTRAEPDAAAVYIHPFLNGDTPSPDFHCDLAPSTFVPMRRIATYPPSGALIGAAELHAPAFYPPLFALRVVHSRLPFWPIDLALPPDAQAPPITLADVLVALHRVFHTPITHADWAGLGSAHEGAVRTAFTARCRSEARRSGAAPAQLCDREMAVRSQGVLRVDFLLGKTIFKGLVRAPGDTEGCLRMVTE